MRVLTYHVIAGRLTTAQITHHREQKTVEGGVLNIAVNGGVTREQYDRDGFVVIPNALSEDDRAYFEDAVDRIYDEEEAAGELRPDRSIHVMGWMHRDPRFVELLT